MVLIASLLLAAAPTGGEVHLPLRDYVALVEAAERASRRPSPSDPTVAQLVSHETRLTVDESEVAEVTVTAEVEARGAALKPIPIPVPGAVWSVAVEPPAGAVVGRGAAGVTLVPSRPGRYRVVARSRVQLEGTRASRALTLPPSTAGANRVVAYLPATLDWSSPSAVVITDVVVDGRREVGFTYDGSSPARVELRRLARGAEEDRALARVVAVTLLDVGRDSVRRHDLLLHEVQRGELVLLEAHLPAGYEPDLVATDEGPATPLHDGRTLTVERQKRLTGTGFLALTTRTPLETEMKLPPVDPGVKLRARYLAISSSRVVTPQPLPADAWARVDLGDLPEPVRSEASALGIIAAWRERAPGEDRAVRLDVPPAAPLAAPPVRKRSTTSLLTAEGRILHRDEFTLPAPTPEVFTLDIGGATFWSAEVDDEVVMPAQSAGRVELPLVPNGGDDTVVRIVTVQEQPLPREGTIVLGLPRLPVPVLSHEWRLLLPDDHRYRLRASSLRPARVAVADDEPDLTQRILSGMPRAIAHGPGGSGAIRGLVFDATGAVIPGATVTVSAGGMEMASVVSDENGLFLVDRLRPGRHRVTCELTGFASATREATLRPRSAALVDCLLKVGGIEEVVTVTGEAPVIDVTSSGRADVIRPHDVEDAARSHEAFVDTADELRQGLVAGVKPVSVEVPEEGKILALSGALPSAEVSATLDVRPAR